MASTGPRFTEQQLRKAIAASISWAETLKKLGYQSAGGNWKTLKKYAETWRISTAHFDPDAARLRALHTSPTPLKEILVENSSYSRNHLKARLYAAGLKRRECERCGQGEIWRGRRMALILDHVNGVPNDNRIENLRILCPNCAATLDTHCGLKNKKPPAVRRCARCGKEFAPKHRRHRYCSGYCGSRWDRSQVLGVPKPALRRVERPSYLDLLFDVEETSYAAVAREYGVSDNAIRKWLAQYEREFELYEPSTDLASATASSAPSRDRPRRSA
jgi:ribosomal protein S27AE